MRQVGMGKTGEGRNGRMWASRNECKECGEEWEDTEIRRERENADPLGWLGTT